MWRRRTSQWRRRTSQWRLYFNVKKRRTATLERRRIPAVKWRYIFMSSWWRYILIYRPSCDVKNVTRCHMDVAISTSGMRRRVTLYERRIMEVGSRQIFDVDATSQVGRYQLRPKCNVGATSCAEWVREQFCSVLLRQCTCRLDNIIQMSYFSHYKSTHYKIMHRHNAPSQFFLAFGQKSSWKKQGRSRDFFFWRAGATGRIP